MADTPHTAPRLAKKIDAATLAALFCSGEKEIGLKPYVCSPENRENLIEMFSGKCSLRRVWTVSNGRIVIGMLMLGERTRVKGEGIDVTEISYVIVAPEFRYRGVGPILITHIQSRKDVVSLRAEARNEPSRRMLTRCGFEAVGEKQLERSSVYGMAQTPRISGRAEAVGPRRIDRCGELLREIPASKGGRPTETQDGSVPSLSRTGAAAGAGLSERQRRTALRASSLRDLGVSKQQSSDWQRLAGVPADQFEADLAPAFGRALSDPAVEGTHEDDKKRTDQLEIVRGPQACRFAISISC